MSVYLLWHVHEMTDYDDEKLIGVFSSAEKANATVEEYKNLERFRDCPIECFVIDEYEVDKPANWREGFVTVFPNEENDN